MRTSLMRRSGHAYARVALLCLTLGVLAVSASQPPASQTAPGQRPAFRAGVNFVQVDVYPTANGKPIADLSKEEFEVLEDGVPQTVGTFEHVSIRPAEPGAPRVEPRSEAESKAMAADPHNRVFVLFLDSYHVTDPTAWHDGRMRMPADWKQQRRVREQKPLGPQPIDKAIVRFLEQFVGPNDVVAAMSPEMSANSMVFGRRPERFADWVSTAWARRFSWDDLDPEEELWDRCYPSNDAGDMFGCYRGILEEMVLRRREARTLKALDETITKLGSVREGRKAVLLISEGWPLYRPNQALARALPRVSTRLCPPELPATPNIYVGPTGTLRLGTDPRDPTTVDRHACDAERLRLSNLDNEADFRRLLDRTNRETVSFYPIDPRGLAVFDTPIDAQSPNPYASDLESNLTSKVVSPTADSVQLRGRLETLRNLASASDGFMSDNSNDLDASMKRIAEDLSEYYLIGYNSTNAKLDGKFRKITVRVKRPGVQVRARRGYLAATDAEMRARAAADAPPDPVAAVRESALASLGTMPLDLSLRVAAGFDWVAGPAAGLWAVAELGDAASREPAWREGGKAEITVTSADGSVVASGSGLLSPAARAFAWRPDGPVAAGDYLVRITARPSAGGMSSAGQVRVTLPSPESMANGQAATPRLQRRGPTTGLAFLPTADAKFRRVERIRVVVSVAGNPPVSARLLDRRGQVMAVPVSATLREESGGRSAVAEAALASLAPGDYLLELTIGDASARQTIMTAIRIVP